MSSVFMDKIRLKQLRESNKITQLKLALDLGTNQNTISRYETGEREADYAMLIKIADYFNVSLDYLLYRTDKK
ncbi:MAG: helix-turn-helix domain-containing protein [Clostridia bacterium]|nr:helix-turn-helix domain-containing protein [Clostridia bacterium]